MTKKLVSLSHRERVDRDLRECHGWGKRSITTTEWSYWVDEIGALGVDEVARRIDKKWRSETLLEATESAEPAVNMSTELSAFVYARSALLAARATTDPEVLRFRTEHLGDKLLQPTEIESWIRRVAEAEGPLTQTVTLDVPAGWVPGDPIPINALVHRTVSSVLFPVNGKTDLQPVSKGGVLDQLRVLSEGLSRIHGWQTAQGVAFVLTGHTPLVQMITAKINQHSGQDHLSNESGESFHRQTITFEVDPDTPSELVSAIYTQYRAVLRGTRARLPRSERSRLVAFCAFERLSFRLPDIRRHWNHENTDIEHFPDQREFRVALHDAERRVAGHPRPQR